MPTKEKGEQGRTSLRDPRTKAARDEGASMSLQKPFLGGGTEAGGSRTFSSLPLPTPLPSSVSPKPRLWGCPRSVPLLPLGLLCHSAEHFSEAAATRWQGRPQLHLQVRPHLDSVRWHWAVPGAPFAGAGRARLRPRHPRRGREGKNDPNALQMVGPHDPATPRLDTYLKELKAGPPEILVPFVAARRWKQPRCPSMSEWMTGCGPSRRWNIIQ